MKMVVSMRSWIIKKCMNVIRDTKSFDQTKLEEIEYGLIGIYIFVTKSILIFGLAMVLGVFLELLIFMILYNMIRMPSFGLHATKSWICLVGSSIVFLLGLYVSLYIQIPISIKVIVGIYCIIRIYQNAPADTHKRPIVDKKRREIYKTISTIVAITFVFCSLWIRNSFIANALICSLVIQTGMISPFVYKLFNMPYNNYKTYLFNNL